MYKNKGRPNQSEVSVMSCSEKLKKEIDNLLKKMKIGPGKECLLPLSLCTDEMMYYVHMYPEVWFMDVTASTNLQKRDLFIMVVKDALGNVFPGNVSFLPLGQKWVFSKIYKDIFFIFLEKRQYPGID